MDFSEYGIHILPGDFAAGTWNTVFGAEERLLVHRDDLTCGPLRTFHSLSTWTALRQDFWNTVNPTWAEEDFRHSYDHSVVSDQPRTLERLKQIASAENPEPLLLLRGTSDTYRGAEVTLTDFGQAVLEGRASAYPTNPIDEWIGGVHLSSAEGRLWFNEDGTLRRAQ